MKQKHLDQLMRMNKTDTDQIRASLAAARAQLGDAEQQQTSMNRSAYDMKFDISDGCDQMSAGKYMRFVAMQSQLIESDKEKIKKDIEVIEEQFLEAVRGEKKIEILSKKLQKQQTQHKKKNEDETTDFFNVVRYMMNNKP